MILAGQLASAADVERFNVEAKAAANLQHPNIVAIHEIGQHAGQNYFSMDYVEGHSLAQLVRESPLPAARAAGYVKTIAETIEFAHRQGTLHRDLKPSNILIDAFDQPRVTDFGLAKRIEADAQLTASGSLMGTPSYMSPEQAGANGGKLGPASDVYSLGAVLYELVTGRPPFLGETLIATLNQVLNAEPVAPRLLNANIPRDLETICLKCLQKEPSHRYESASALADDLGRFLKMEPIAARPVGQAERILRWGRRNPLVATLAVSAAVLMLAVAVVSTVGYLKTSEALADAQRERAAGQKRLRDSLVSQGRAERLAGSPWAALDAIGEAARIGPTESLRQDAIQAITSPGARLRYEIPFGQALSIRISSDGALLAVTGFLYGDLQEGANLPQIVVYGVADGHVVDRIDAGPSTLSGDSIAFRPRTSILAFAAKAQDNKWGIRLRDVNAGKDVGWIPDAKNILFSPDGKTVVDVTAGRLHVRDAGTLRDRNSLAADAAIAFLSDDELLVEKDRLLRGWNLRTDRETCAFTIPEGMYRLGQEDLIGSAVMLADPRGRQPFVAAWDVRAGKELARFDDAVLQDVALRRTAPGTLVALDSRSRPGDIFLYDVVRQEGLRRLDGVVKGGGNFNLEQRSTLSPDGRLLAAYTRTEKEETASTIRIWDVETGQSIALLHNCHKPLWSSDCRHLVTVGSGMVGSTRSPEALVAVWEVTAPTPTYRHNRPVATISWSPDGRRLAVNDRLWEVATAGEVEYLRPLPASRKGEWMAFTRSGTLYAARPRNPSMLSGHPEQPASIWQLEPQRREILLPANEVAEGVSYVNVERLFAFSPDAKVLAVLSQRWVPGKYPTMAGDEIDVCDLAASKRLHVLDQGIRVGLVGNPRQLVFSPDSKKLAVAFNTGVVLYKVPGGKPIRWLANRNVVRPVPQSSQSIPTHCAAFSPDGRWIYYAGEQGRINIGSVAPVPGELRPPFMTVAARDGSWEVSECDPIRAWKGHEGAVVALAVSPDGRVLASGGDDRSIRLWELPSGRPLAQWEAHDASVSALAFRPDGAVLVSGASDGMVKLWDLPLIRHELSALGLDW
jgi:WD40 repeat protein